jgi:hypothetical protein
VESGSERRISIAGEIANIAKADAGSLKRDREIQGIRYRK